MTLIWNCLCSLLSIRFCSSHSIQQNSSVEGVFAPQRSTHPFRIIENDTMSIQSMTSLGRVGRILAGTIDVTNSIGDKDTQSTNASTADCNVMTAATTSNAAATTISSMAGDASSSSSSTERKAKSTVSSCNLNDSSTSSNDNTSNNAMTLQGKRTLNWKQLISILL